MDKWGISGPKCQNCQNPRVGMVRWPEEGDAYICIVCLREGFRTLEAELDLERAKIAPAESPIQKPESEGDSLLMYVIKDLTATFTDDERLLLFEYMRGRYCMGCGRPQLEDPNAQRCQCRDDS